MNIIADKTFQNHHLHFGNSDLRKIPVVSSFTYGLKPYRIRLKKNVHCIILLSGDAGSRGALAYWVSNMQL